MQHCICTFPDLKRSKLWSELCILKKTSKIRLTFFYSHINIVSLLKFLKKDGIAERCSRPGVVRLFCSRAILNKKSATGRTIPPPPILKPKRGLLRVFHNKIVSKRSLQGPQKCLAGRSLAGRSLAMSVVDLKKLIKNIQTTIV